jgi:hypothetical protein
MSERSGGSNGGGELLRARKTQRKFSGRLEDGSALEFRFNAGPNQGA